jgi:SPP1 family predicted phage head-tail adaptor
MTAKTTTSSRLRHRLTLQAEVMTPDGAGGYVRTWNDVANIWAEIIPFSGRERFFSGKIQAETTHRILLRYRSDITAAHRLMFENRIFNIRAIMNAREQRDVLELLVEEGVAT